MVFIWSTSPSKAEEHTQERGAWAQIHTTKIFNNLEESRSMFFMISEKIYFMERMFV